MQEKVGGLSKTLDRLGLGTEGGDTAHTLQSTRSRVAHASVSLVTPARSLIELPPGPWNESKRSSESLLVASRAEDAWEATRISKIQPIPWMMFETQLPT